MKDLAKIQEFFSKPLNEESTTFKVGDKVTYLGHPAEITAVNKEMTGEITYNVAYNKGQGRTKASNINRDNIKRLNEANGFKSGKEFINIKLQKYPKAVAKINQLISMVGESNFTMEMAEWLFDFFNNASFERPVNEAKKEDKVDTITMDIPLFLRMLEYSREDASQDMDLHDVTEKANLLGKERGILQMDDYDEIVGAAEEIKEGMGNEVGDKVYFKNEVGEKYPSFKGYYGIIEDTTPARNYNMMATYDVVVYDKNDNEIRTITTDFTNLTSKAVNEAVNLKQAKLSSAEYQKAKKLKDFKASDWKWNADEDLYTKVNEAELTEAYVPSNIKEFAKRKGVSSLVNKVAGWAEKVGKGIRGGTAIGKDYSTLILDMGYQTADIYINTENGTIELYGEPVENFNEFQRVYNKKDLTERVINRLKNDPRRTKR
jgi:hypothetical protein